MRLPILLLALVWFAAIGAVMIWGASRFEKQGAFDAAPTAAVRSDSATGKPRNTVQAQTATKARPVAPDVVAPPPLEPETLERVEPRKPLGDLALAVPPEPGKPEPRLLYRPVASAAGSLEAQGYSVEIEGVVPVEPNRTCSAGDGSSWPCGMVARTAFRNWLRGRAVTCTVGGPPAPSPVTSACALGDQDIGLWLVENGFATARPDSDYVAAGKQAEAEGRGIFGPGPRGHAVATSSPAKALSISARVSSTP